MMIHNIYKENGFTLIELIVVIAIIGILSAVAVPSFMNIVEDANYAKLEVAMGALASSASTLFALYIASGGDPNNMNDQFTNNGTIINVSYGYPNGSDIMKYMKLTSYNIEIKNEVVRIRNKPKDKIHVHYDAGIKGLDLKIH